MTLLEVGFILLAPSIILLAIGYNLKLPGYKRKSMLEGYSVTDQMIHRRRIGDSLIIIGTWASVCIIFVVFFLLGTVVPYKTEVIHPKEIVVISAQGKTVVIADEKIYEFHEPHYHIKNIYYKKCINEYGFQCLDGSSELVIEDMEEWEVLGR